MKKIKNANTNKSSSFFDTKEKMIKVSIVVAVVVLLIAVFMFVESSEGKFVIKNKTDMKLEYVKAYYVYEEGIVEEGLDIKTESIEANKSMILPMMPIDLINYGANLEVRFKFENYDEMFVDAGIFNDTFKGNINVDFEKTDDNDMLILKVRAKNGILQSTLIDCDEEFIVNLSEGYIED